MKFSWEHLVAIAVAVVVVLLAWFSGPWLHLTGVNRAILSIGILVIGAAAIGGFLMWAASNQPPKPAASTGAPAPDGATSFGGASPTGVSGSPVASGDIDFLIREAEKKVAQARLGHGTKLSGLRQVFVLGEARSGKTEAVLHSGLDPELLAGHAYQEGAVVPTEAANFWFARKTVLIEAGANVVAEPRTWARLVRRLTSGGLKAIFSGKSQGERAAVVCVDCEKLAGTSTTDALATSSRFLRSRLEEMSQTLGSSFPVYVLFTRADRLPFFDDFVSTLSTEECSQILGVTLSAAAEPNTGVYAERETKRLSTAFNGLFHSLSDYRIELLSRETNTDRKPGIYEHPREFSKISKRAVQFLVDLCRPSQLRAGPFLRGFYFSGRRMVASAGVGASTTVVAGRSSLMVPAEPAANATTILRQEDLATGTATWQSATQFQPTESRKVPQWVFLSHIFSNVVLQDRAALGASGVSSRGDFWRRILFASAIVIGIVWIIGSLVSVFSNRSLEDGVLQAAQALQGSDSSCQQPSTDCLKRLDSLRTQLATLEGYGNDGPPLHLRWGLYSGGETYAQGSRIYFDHFFAQILAQSEYSMASTLRQLPSTPGPNDDYTAAYNTLKAYLITTSNPEKSTSDFLSPALLKNWPAGQNLDSNGQSISRAQFDFYANELKLQNPYSLQTDSQAREHAREYLNRFGAVPRIYAAMQNAAIKANPAVNFYKEHPDSSDVIRAVPEVSGAFTKVGWDFMQDAITHSDRYFQGEDWVLGGTNQAVTNRADLESQIRTMYQADFIKNWQNFVREAKVAGYGGSTDEIRKLKKLSANDSPLIALLCDVSQNTTGRSTGVDNEFKPVQTVAPSPACASAVPPSLIPYVGGLATFENCLETPAVPGAPGQPPSQPCVPVMSQTRLVVTAQVMPGIGVGLPSHIEQAVQQLLLAPIGVSGPVAEGPGGLCSSFSQLASKFPFNPRNSSQDVSLQDFDAFFNPVSGLLQKFVQSNQAVVSVQGAQYMLKAGSNAGWSPAFLGFLNNSHFLQQLLYPPATTGTAQLQYRFNVRATPPEAGITGESFTMNGLVLKYPGGSQTMSFTWPGAGAQEARISYRAGGGEDTDLLSQQGPWAIIKLLSIPGVKVTASSAAVSAEWHALQADGRTPLTLSGTGKPIVVRLDFDGGGGAPFALQAGNFSNLSCRVTR